MEVRVDTWGGGQIQGRRGGALQNSTDLKGRREQEMLYEVVTQAAEASKLQASLTEEKILLSRLELSFVARNHRHIS